MPSESTDDTDRNPYANYPDNPTKEPDIPNTKEWHVTGQLPNGWCVGKLGALWYILDEQGWAISDGYHEISDDGCVGKLGGTEQGIELRGEPTHTLRVDAEHKEGTDE